MLPENLQEIIDHFSTNCFVIEEIAETKKSYSEFTEYVYDCIKAGFEHKELRECPVYFRFHPDTDINQMQLRHFLTNLFFWEPVIRLSAIDELNEKYIVDTSAISSPYIKKYIDNNIIIPFRDTISNKKMNIILHDLIYNLGRISTDFNILLGMTINIETFIDVANKNKRFDEIIRTKLDPSLQPNEIESLLDGLLKEELDILMTEENSLKPILKSGAGIKPKQLAELSISGGLSLICSSR